MGILYGQAKGYKYTFFSLILDFFPGEVGLLISPLDPRKQQFRGYLGGRSASEKKVLRDVFVDGDQYFNNGDLLRLDKDYFVYFNDRVGDTFRSCIQDTNGSCLQVIHF